MGRASQEVSFLFRDLGEIAQEKHRMKWGRRPVSRVLSRAIIPLRTASPQPFSSLPGSTRDPRCSRILRPPATSLFGLAPGGVCHAVECYHRRGALLPHRFTLTSTLASTSAVYFLLHFPWARAPQALPGTLSTGVRTFLPGASCDVPQRLPDRLPRAHLSTPWRAPSARWRHAMRALELGRCR